MNPKSSAKAEARDRKVEAKAMAVTETMAVNSATREAAFHKIQAALEGLQPLTPKQGAAMLKIAYIDAVRRGTLAKIEKAPKVKAPKATPPEDVTVGRVIKVRTSKGNVQGIYTGVDGKGRTVVTTPGFKLVRGEYVAS
jgi:hypothetical protein